MTALNTEHIARRCRELKTDELLRVAIVESDDLEAAAQEIWRAELMSRLGNLAEYVAGFGEAFGEEIVQISGVSNYRNAPPSDVYVGRLTLAAGGIGFRASGNDNHGSAVRQVLGPIVAPVFEHVFDQIDTSSVDWLPLPFLAEIYEAIFWHPRERIAAVDLKDGRLLSLRSEHQELAWCVVTDSAPALRAWSDETGIPFTESQSVGLWTKMKGLFGK